MADERKNPTCDALADCQAGTPPPCEDDVTCTVDSCNEALDSCENTTSDSLCDDGLFCNGAETCDAAADCQAGIAPDIDDGVACTADSCDEAADTVLHAGDILMASVKEEAFSRVERYMEE